jgi:hypothetical protein
MIEVGDCFKNMGYIYIFEVIHIKQHPTRVAYRCNVWHNGMKVSLTEEHKNTLLKMQKLSKLEKELM